MLWPDTFNNHFRPRTAVAAAHVLEELGFNVPLPRQRATPAETLVIADGFSCREQIEQCAGRRTLHLAEVVAGVA